MDPSTREITRPESRQGKESIATTLGRPTKEAGSMGAKEGKALCTLPKGSFSRRASGKMALSAGRESPKKQERLKAKTKR
jgi:hypothetical protein